MPLWISEKSKEDRLLLVTDVNLSFLLLQNNNSLLSPAENKGGEG